MAASAHSDLPRTAFPSLETNPQLCQAFQHESDLQAAFYTGFGFHRDFLSAPSPVDWHTRRSYRPLIQNSAIREVVGLVSSRDPLD